jgi:hypothetical protein
MINGFRFGTATHIFLFGVFKIFYFRDIRLGFLCILLSVATHIAFMLPLAILLAYLLIPKNGWIFLGILMISILFLRLDLNFIISLVPEIMWKSGNPVLLNYLNEEYASSRLSDVQKLNWYARYRLLPIYLYTVIITIYILSLGVRISANSGWKHMMYFGVLLFSIAGILTVIPSAARFYSLAYLFIFGALFLLAQKERISISNQWIFMIAIMFVLLPITVELRKAMDFFGPSTFFNSHWLPGIWTVSMLLARL